MSSGKKDPNRKINFKAVPATDIADFIEDDDDEETMCGVGGFKPRWLQRFANPKMFLLNHSILGVLQGAFFTYLVGCLSTLEKKFAYETKVTGIIMIADEISPILLGLFLGYFGGKSHRPRIVAAGMVITVISCFVMSLPHFIYGPAIHSSTDPTNIEFNTTKVQFCDAEREKEVCKKSTTFTAVSLLFFGNFLKGFGSLAFYTIGTTFLDDNVKKKNSPVYFGTLFALRLLGPTLGFLLSSLCLQYYENPFVDPGFSPNDPRWVGAWWLGFIVLGVAIFIFSIPMILFPRRFPGKNLSPSLRKKKKDPEPESPLQQLKGMGRALKRLGRNPILICHYLGGVLRLNGVVGYYVLLPKYMEMQFKQSASKANLYSGPASIIGMKLGILFGGIAIRKFKPRPRMLTGGIVIAESFSVIALISCMLITCPLLQMTGTTYMTDQQTVKLQNECNAECACTTKVFAPVCGPDGKSTYFSPCYAGCTGYRKTNGTQYFSDCKCVHNETGAEIIGEAEKSYCDSECQYMVAFVVILSLGKLISSTARVANTIVTLRCVDPEDKSIALGALSGIFSLLAFIPYPLIYGALTDASCLVWEESCGKTGNCWIYDPDKFRFLLHGVSAMFVFLGCITDIFVCILSPRLQNLYDEEDDDKKADPNPDIRNGGMLGTGYQSGSLHSLNSLDDRY